MRGIKKRQHLWICPIDFDTQTIHCESDDVKCDAKLMEYSSKAALIYFFWQQNMLFGARQVVYSGFIRAGARS